MKQTDLLRTDRAGEEYFIEEARDFTQNTGGAKKESAFQKISFPVLERMKERMHKKLCKGAERKSHRETSHKNSVGSAYANMLCAITGMQLIERKFQRPLTDTMSDAILSKEIRAKRSEMKRRNCMKQKTLKAVSVGNDKAGYELKISTRGKYGLRAMIDLALYSEQEAVSISSIALRQNISESYLEQLMAKLKKAGLVISTRGAQGGYRLALPMCEISVGDVLRAVEGDLRAVECTAHTDEGCQGEELCVTKYVWQRINESIARTVDEMMLDQLVAESRKAQEKAKAHSVDYSQNSCSG